MKYGDIVRYGNRIGKVVTDRETNTFRFLPCGHGSCYFSALDIVTENDVIEATHEEKVKLITEEYTWGEVVKVHCIGEYQMSSKLLESETEKYSGMDILITEIQTLVTVLWILH